VKSSARWLLERTRADGSTRLHAESAAALGAAPGPLLLSPFVLAELDYLIATRVGAPARKALLDDVVRGAYRLEPFSPADVEEAPRLTSATSGF
jgi:hypothetical protein